MRGHVQWANSAHFVRKRAIRPVKADVRKLPESAPAAWMAGTEIRATKPVALVVLSDVTRLMEIVLVNQVGKDMTVGVWKSCCYYFFSDILKL